MAKLDVKDKDPFAHADDKPKDDITILGFISRAAYRYFRLIVLIYLFYAAIYYFVFGESILDQFNF